MKIDQGAAEKVESASCRRRLYPVAAAKRHFAEESGACGARDRLKPAPTTYLSLNFHFLILLEK
jgi:hypothetical protein